MFTTETQVRVRYAETDQMGVVYHSNYFPLVVSFRF
jgi:acyl-CoA thioester hydrolase